MLQSSLKTGTAAAPARLQEDYYEIHLAGRSQRVRVDYSAVRNLHASVTDGLPFYGLLIGSVTNELITICACETVSAAEITAETFRKAKAQNDCVVGFFRTQASGWPEMEKLDCEVAKECFANSDAVFLLVQTPLHRPWSALLFDFNSDHPAASKRPACEFFFDEYLLRSGYSTNLITQPEELAWDERRSWRDNPWLTIAAVAAVLSVGASAVWLVSGKDRVETQYKAPVSTGLALKVIRIGSDFEVSWDRQAAALQQDARGTLTVLDGDITKTLPLDLQKLKEGRILYTPLFSELNFRLEVEQGLRTQAESVQVFSWDPNRAANAIAKLSPDAAKSPAPVPVPAAPYKFVPTPAWSPQGSVPSAAPYNGWAAKAPVVPKKFPAAAGVNALLPPPKDSSNPKAPIAATANSTLPPQAAMPTAPVITEAPADVWVDVSNAIPIPAKGITLAEPPPAPTSTAPVAATSAPEKAPVTPSYPEFVPPLATFRVVPQIPDAAKRSLTRSGHYHLNVLTRVDVNGAVTKAELLSPGGDRMFVDANVKFAVLNAAQRWKFRPGTMHGKPVDSDVIVTFNFD